MSVQRTRRVEGRTRSSQGEISTSRSLITEIARKNTILRSLPLQELQHIIRLLHHVKWTRGEVIIEARRPIHSVYFPINGVVAINAVMTDGDSATVALVGHEGFSGVPALFAVRTTLLRHTVLLDGEALRLGTRELIALLRTMPTLKISVCRYARALLEQIANRAACNQFHEVRKRVVFWLLMIRERTEAEIVPITHEALAEMLGCRRASVTQALRSLEAVGSLHCGRGYIRFVNGKLLQENTCECYSTLAQLPV